MMPRRDFLKSLAAGVAASMLTANLALGQRYPMADR